MTWIGFVQGIAVNILLLLGFVALLSMLRRWKTTEKPFHAACMDGFLFSAMAVVAMAVPVQAGPGVIFDCRAGVIGAAALLGGPLCALISIPLPLLFRLQIGGAGMIPGLLEILMPALLGSIYFKLGRLHPRPLTVRDAIIYSIVVGISTNGLIAASIFLLMPNKDLILGLGSTMMVVFLHGPVSMALVSILLLLSRQSFDHARIHSSILQTAMDGYWLANLQGRLREVNETYCRMSGYGKAELLARRIVDVEAAMSEQQVNARNAEIVKGGGQRFESCHRRKDGSTFEIEASVQYVPVGDGRFVSFIRDITERKRAEEALRASEEKYRTLVEQSIQAVVIIQNGRFVFANKAMGAIAGYAVEELSSLSPEHVKATVHPEDQDQVWGRLRRRLAGEPAPSNNEFRALRKDGTVRWLESFSGLIEYDGKPAVQAVIVDVTERKRAETEARKLQDQLLQARKMESIGRLAGGVAHDFNNLLTGIMGFTELAMMQTAAESPVREMLAEILVNANRSAGITRQLLAFARKQAIVPNIFDLNDHVAGMLKLLRRMTGEGIHLVWRPEAVAMRVNMDPSQTDQILINLVVNARDAMGVVGTVAIETREAVLEDAYCAEHPDAAPGEYVLLTVGDTGCGMDKATLANIFEPFFTTKEVGKGTGLGLPTVHGIVKQNGGHLDVESEPARGTTFRIYLPICRDAPQVPHDTEASTLPGGTETILVVEDEKAIRMMMRIFLDALGYTVLSAETPHEALRLATEHPGRIHLLITDVVMPELSGCELAEQVRKQRPETRRLFISGYSSDVLGAQNMDGEGLQYLQKPFTRVQLVEKVRKILDRS